jgi:CrcB protein
VSQPGRYDELPLDPDAAVLGSTTPLHLQPRLLAAVAVGALFGGPARYGIGRAWPPGATPLPTSTLVINLSGALLLGVILEALAHLGDDTGRRRTVRLIAGTGFCGTFTTYSALAVASDLLLRHHRFEIAVTYCIVSVFGGVLATGIGIALAAGHHRRRVRLPIDPDTMHGVER